MTITIRATSIETALQRPRVILALVVLATGLSSLEVGLVNVALPTLTATFDVRPSTTQWVVIAYQLAIVGTLILFGRLVDLYGSRTLYLAGMATVGLASLLATTSQTALWLILARGLLGLGAAMLLATGQALVTTAYPAERRGRALGVMHMAVAGGLMAGPPIGGLLLAGVGWRAVFLAPVPLAVGALLCGWSSLPRADHRDRVRVDISGTMLIFVTIAFAVLSMTRLAQHGWENWTGSLLALAFLAGLAFVLVERNRAAPLVDLGLLRRVNLSIGLLVTFLTFIALASNMFLIPFTLQDLMGHSTRAAGLLMMAVPLAILPVAPLAGALADRVGSRLPATVGLITIAIAIIGMAQLRSTSSTWVAVAVLIVYGVGAGFFQAPNNREVLSSAPDERVGSVSGMLALARNLGQIAGVAVASTVWTWQQAHYERVADPPLGDPLAASLRDAFFVLAGFSVLALLVSALQSRPFLAKEGTHGA